MSLIALDDAKLHLNITDTSHDSDVAMKLDAAEAIVLDYIGSTSTWRTTAAAWTADTLPAVVQAAILVQLGELYGASGRGDDAKGPVYTPGQLSPQVTNYLMRYRDPVVA